MIHLFRAVVCWSVLLLAGSPSRSNPHPSFSELSIDPHYPGMSCAVLFDIDGDGDEDVVGGSETTPVSSSVGVAWWRNDGGDPVAWTRFTVDPSFINVMSVEVADVDGDNFPDIVATSWDQHAIAWWKNSGNPTTGWQRRYVKQSFSNAHDAECCDVNQDGYTDVVGICSTPGTVVVCYNNGAVVPSWNIQTLSNSFSGGKSVEVMDFDRDGDTDIIGAAADANQIVWWENFGGNPVVWIPHVVTANLLGSHDIDVVDMNGDSVYDLVATAWRSNEVSLWLCDNLPANQWTKVVLTNQLQIAVKALGRDFDGDGDVDVVATGKIPGELIVFENEGSSWIQRSLKQDYTGGWALAAGDIDDDGAVDFVTGASALGTLSWWKNGVPVPVQITSFTAQAVDAGVKLEWGVYCDEQVQGFRVYKRKSGRDEFEPANPGRLIPAERTAYVDSEVESGRVYCYCLAVVRMDGSETISPAVTIRIPVRRIVLDQNYPNPFNPETVISFTLPEKARTNLSIFDVDGRLVLTLVNEVREEGAHRLSWNGRDANGIQMSSGLYLYRLRAGNVTLTKKMLLLK